MPKEFKSFFLFVLIVVWAFPVWAQQELVITSWNIETLGGSGRGFAGGFGAGVIPSRTPAQLRAIAHLIRDDLHSDVIAIQEVSMTHLDAGVPRSTPLDVIVQELGPDWEYFLPTVTQIPTGHDNLFCALLWNGDRVNRLQTYAMDVPNVELAGAHLFDREPVVGYFEARNNGQGTNDFVVVNVHMKSGQGNEENHLIAMTVLEHSLTSSLSANQIKESDRIILGDFNDNPYATTNAGNQSFSTALYHHMAFKKYADLVTQNVGFTRMNQSLDSVIDHILVNSSAQRHILDNEATKFLPGPNSDFAQWRQTFSDHFPLSFRIRIETSDDDVDFQ